MAERGAGQRSWPLSPYDVNISFAANGAAGDTGSWFGPSAPVTPLAPPGAAGRQWDYPAGYNLSTLSRPFEPVTFSTLRNLADGYDLLRLVIETRKDQASRQSWSIAARDAGEGSVTDTARIAAIKRFLARPDGIHGFADWLRILLEEVLVTDAPALFMSRDRRGRLRALMLLDGATIKPVIDPWGRQPQPYIDGGKAVYPTAYQQILKGYPAINYSVRDLIYRPRNLRVNRVYGMSPVEQIVTTVNIALRRQLYLLDYYSEGNVPDSLIGVPENWTPDQIASYQKYWDAYFDGDPGRRRRAKFVPGGVAKTFIQTQEPELKGAFDEWLARIVCFAFSISPQALAQSLNRATAETQKELAEEEGLGPILGWAKALIDDVLASEFDAPDLEFVWTSGHETDPATQEKILSSYTSKGILTINEARAALGRAPLAEASANRAMTLSNAGYVMLPEQA
ncbi:MAG: phage portal protein [Beijerinckiaceae bacterium]|nr:phage portal protein [Beijerinckiaceae bacterium]